MYTMLAMKNVSDVDKEKYKSKTDYDHHFMMKFDTCFI